LKKTHNTTSKNRRHTDTEKAYLGFRQSWIDATR